MTPPIVYLQPFFSEHSYTDAKFSWEEIQTAQKEGVTFYDSSYNKTTLALGVEITRQDFDAAQNPALDLSPDKLNHLELINLLQPKGVEVQWSYPGYEGGNRGRGIPHCDNASVVSTLSGEGILAVRKTVRDGIATELKKSWPAKKAEIAAEIQAGNLSNAMKLLTDYFPDVAKKAHYENPSLEKLCTTGCVSELFEIEEFASKGALANTTIKGFWTGVGTLMTSLLDKAKEQGLTDLSPVWGKNYDQDKLSFYFKAATDRYPAYAPKSDFTFMALLERTNPTVVERIRTWNQ